LIKFKGGLVAKSKVRIGNFHDGTTLDRISKSRFFGLYGFLAILILAATTIFWSLLGARLQQSNADQLVNSYLFENLSSLHGAQIPGAHTQLIKWPLFALIRAFGYSSTTFITFTILLCLATVGLFAYLLYRIDKRPFVFGTLCLALASVLLLVPTQPYAGGLLPVNMAMVATRNLEYIFFIACLAILISSPKIKSPRFWIAVAFLGLLIASDKLFFSLSAGGAVLALLAYSLSKGWNLVTTSANWLIGTLLGGIFAAAILWLLNTSGLIHIVSSSEVAPYQLTSSLHDALLGIFYAFMGLTTNLGANPAFDATTLSSVGHNLANGLRGVGGVAFLVNLAVLIVSIVVMGRLLLMSLAHNKSRDVEINYFSKLSVFLIWTSIASLIIFVASNHYYAVDARYLNICLFTVFVSLAAYLSTKQLRPEPFMIIGLIMIVSICLGVLSALHVYRNQSLPLSEVNRRDRLVSQALAQHPVIVLVGDYWRVVPERNYSKNAIKVLPLQNCFEIRQVLTSKDWQYNLNSSSFAYLLSFDRGLTDFPSCSLQQVISNYGRPNSSVVIAGSQASPKEVLLFYDHGAHKSAPVTKLKTPSTVLPVSIYELPNTTCPVPSVMNIVAHQDDDLLFMNPDLYHDIKAGHCVRTVYVTGGDAGAQQYYWLSRERGSEAAYSTMTGSSDIWIERVVQLPSGQYTTIANPRGNSKISLIFLHLPDGNINGQGFPSSKFETLEKLDSKKINFIHTIYSGSSYTSDELTDSLSDLMHVYQPAEIRTQSNFVSTKYPDHSDHMAVGRFTQKAHDKYEIQQFEGKLSIPLKFYIGYPIHEMPENVAGGDLDAKSRAFFAYAKFDGGVCRSMDECSNKSVYSTYLKRQYQNSY
jgi:LmbE family N-acetylglucosaminyl deacetylase